MCTGRNGLFISHLMFADDLLLFCRAMPCHMRSVMQVLDCFCSLSGQKVSEEKTMLFFFSKNVSLETRQEIVGISKFMEVQSLGNYLGVPALGRPPKRSDFRYLMGRVKKKLAGWKASQLSLAGRITLSKSVIEAMPIYPMMTMKLPSACLEEIHRLQRAFIWGETSSRKRVHQVGWHTMILPKIMGGLGLRDLHKMNDTCIMKFGWALRQGSQSLWYQVLRGKYGCGTLEDGVITMCDSDSSFWKAISQVWPTLEEHQYWAIGNGNSIDAWRDKWVNTSLRINEVVADLPTFVRGWKASDLVDCEGKWKIQELGHFLPADILQQILAILPPSSSNGQDTSLCGLVIVWGVSPSLVFIIFYAISRRSDTRNGHNSGR